MTAYGAVTLVLAGLLTLTGCLSGAGSLMFFSWFNAMQSAPSPSTGSSGCNGFFAAIFWGLAIVLAIVTAVHLILAGGHFTVGIGVLGRRAWRGFSPLWFPFSRLATEASFSTWSARR